MWTKQSRGRMAEIARKTKRYPSDLTDGEWERIAPLMPKPGRRGRPREIEFREVINAVRYLVRSGCGWRMLPFHFGSRPHRRTFAVRRRQEGSRAQAPYRGRHGRAAADGEPD